MATKVALTKVPTNKKEDPAVPINPLDKEEEDLTRPYFNRNEGEIGIYINIYDAVPEHPHEHGSEHFYHSLLMDQLYEHFTSSDIVKYRAALDKKGLFKGTYLERFEKGVLLIILAVGFDDVDNLDAIWRLQNKKMLGTHLTDVLLNHALLKKLGATKILLSTRLFEDEYTACSEELTKHKKAIDLASKEKDLEIVRKMNKYRIKLSSDVQEIRDIENDMELKLGAFIQEMKGILDKDQEIIKTYKDFETYVKIAKGMRNHHKKMKMEAVDFYMSVVKKWKEYFAEIDTSLCYPLLQIHKACENENQQKLKSSIRTLCQDTLLKLRNDADLQTIIHPTWQAKVLPREKKLFCGLVCLIAVAADAAVDISYALDEYLSAFSVRS